MMPVLSEDTHNTSTGVRIYKLTELPKGLEKLTQLRTLWLNYNSALTKAQIAELQKVLPKCKIFQDVTLLLAVKVRLD